MTQVALKFFCSVFDCTPDDIKWHEPKPAQERKPCVIHRPAEGKTCPTGRNGMDGITNYQMSIRAKPDAVRVGLYFNGEEMYHAMAKIFGNDELALVQAISYATHMIYKFAEQKALTGGNHDKI